MKLLQCTEYAHEVKSMVKEYVSKCDKHMQLIVYSNPDDPASKVYLRNKKNICEECGIEFTDIPTVEEQSADIYPTQLPWIVQFPANNIGKVLSVTCDSTMDVDGTNVWSIGALNHVPSYKLLKDVALPCTPLGIVYIIKKQFGDDISGKKVVIINRSNLVGKPVYKMLLDENCSVTMCHSKSGLDSIKQYCKDADIIITAVGKAKYFDSSFLPSPEEQSKQVLILDVSINRNELGKLCGDVDVDEMVNTGITDNVTVTIVPKGIGVMTTAMLAHNICVLNGMTPWYFQE